MAQDITEVGPVGLKGLKGISQLDSMEEKEFNDYLNSFSTPNMKSIIRGNSPTLSDDFEINTGVGVGDSMWDNEIYNEDEIRRAGDIRAENQWAIAKVSAGLTKGAVLAGTTFLNGTLGLVYGIGTAINEGKWSGLWDNDFSNTMDEFNQWSEKELPNYYTQDEIDNPMTLRNIFSANFLGDKFIKNIGFTVGAFYSGGVYSKGLGAILKAVKAVTKATAITQQGVGSVLSAVNEGSFEALNAANEFEQKYKPAIDDNYRQKIQAIQAEYEANRGKQMVRAGVEGNQFVDPAYIKYKQDMERERDNYNKALAKLQEGKAKVGNTTLLLNIPIITASNIYQFGNLYSKGFNTARKTADVVLDESGKYAAKNTSRLYRAGRILGVGIMEGSEEVEQQLASDTQQHYYGTDFNNFYRSLQDPEAAQETLDWTKSFGETLSRTMGEASTWEQFMIGSMTGFLGMPRFRGIRNEQGKLQSPVVLQKNMVSRWKELSQEAARNKAVADELNARISSPEFQNYYQGLIRHKKYQNDMNDAVLRDDEFDFKNAEHAQLLSDIDMFNKAGRLEDLKYMVSDTLDTSDANLDAIIRNTTTVDSNGKLIGPYAKFAIKNSDGSISSNFGNNGSKQEMIESLTKDRDEVMDTINEYEKIREELDNKSGYRFTDEQLDELTWMKSQLGNWTKRAGEMSGQVKEAIGSVIGRLESQKRAAEAVRQHEGMANADLSENYRKADRIIQQIDKAVKNLDLIRNLDDETAAATLAKNPNILEGLKEQINKLDDGVMSADDKKDIIKKLDDLSRLGSASDIYQKKFAEYLLNPTKIDEDHAKVNEENTKKNADVDRAAQVDALNKTANFQEVQELIDNGEASIDDLESSSSDAAKSYKKASLFKKKATELINSSNSEHKAELLDMLNRRFNENATYEDLSDESLVTDLPLEATTWDEKAQESLDNEFNKIVIAAREKVDSGNSQKQDVEARKTGTKRPENAGKDDVAQPPASKPFSIKEVTDKIDKLNLTPEVKTEAKSLANAIAKDIERLEKSKDPKLARKVQRDVNTLFSMVGGDAIATLVDRVRELTKSDMLNPSSPEEVLGNIEAELGKFKPTAVTGVLKAVVPQFDLDAKRDGVLINFVHGETNKGYSYVYNKLNEPQIILSSNYDKVSKDLLESVIILDEATIRPDGTVAITFSGVEGYSYIEGDGARKLLDILLPTGLESTRTTKSGKVIKGKYISKKDSDGFTHISFEGPNAAKARKSFEELQSEGITIKDILGDKKDWETITTGKSAFDYVNEGNISEGDELEVRYEEANDEHPELLALYHEGTLVNYMNTDEAIEGVKEIKDKAKKGGNPTVRVSKIMDGQYGYDRTKTQSVGELLGTDDAVIGVMKNRAMEANTDKFVEPVFDEANSDGKIYILLPNSKGTLSPKQVYIRHLNKAEFDLATQDNPIANDIRKTFNDLAALANLDKGFDEALDNVYMDLIDLLYIPDSFHINIVSRANEVSLQIAFADREGKRQNRNILLKRFPRRSILSLGAGTTQDTEAYTATPEEVYNQVVNAFYEANLAFNVDAKKLAGKNGQAYANRLRDSNVLATYLTGKRMQGTWFLLNEKPNATHTNSAFERQKASQQAKGGTRVQFGGNEYFVRNGIIFDQTGSIVDLGDKSQQVKDLAYINSAYGTSYFGVNQHDGKVLIVDKNGKRGYNRTTNKYLTPKEVEDLEAILEGRKSKASKSATAVKTLQDSQKSVLRDDNGNPDTSNGFYMILEEDGQYHEYQRVHSVIGSNYIGPSKGDAATSRGSVVDGVARQFLLDPTNVTKPESMSDEAFGALKRGLGKFRDDANKRGLKLVTNRTVVFHKYSDGRRIAGELDVFAYNPSTGEISIFDFKTSKYSTKDTAFSRVTRPDMFTRSTKEQYTLQLSAYAKLFEDSFGVPVSNLIIVPFQLKYSKEKEGGISRVNPENYIPLKYQSGVFQRADTPSANSLRTVKGQYVTMKDGKTEYHQADLQELFTTKGGQTFYLAKVGDSYKLILPNGRSMTIDSSLVSDEAGRTRNNIMDFIMADNVSAAIQGAMESKPLENSPYGNSIEIKGVPEKPAQAPKTAPQPSEKMQRGFAALDRLNDLKPTTPTKPAANQEAINQREKDKKATVAIDTSTPLGRSQLARKKWGEMSEAEKSIITPMFEGMSDQEIQEYWDGTDATQRETFIPACK